MARAYAALRKAAAHRHLRLAFFCLLAVDAKWPTLDRAGYLNDFRDAQYFTLFEEAARLAVVRFHQLPLWDPYYCGGISAIGTPSARFVSPTFLLTLLFGTLRADALIAMLMTIIGLEGTFRYLQARGGGALGAMLAAPVFAMSGVFAHTPTMGWTNFFGFELVPWALLGIRQALGGSRRGVVLAGGAVAWMVGFGGTYSGPLTILAAAVEVIEALVRRAHRPRSMGYVVAMGALVVVLAAGLSMIRLWPVAESLSAAPRIIGGTPGESPRRIWELLFGDRVRHFRRADFLIGLPVVPLVVLGSGRKRALALTFSGLIWVWLALGFKAPGSPTTSLFALLRAVPPYTMLRAPERFLVFFALAAAAIAALGVRRLEVSAKRKPIFYVPAAVCLGLLIWNATILTLNDHVEARSRIMLPPPTTIVRDFRQARGNRWLAAYYPWISRGTLSCFDDYDVAQSPLLRGDLTHEEYLDDPGAGTVARRAWTPDRIDLHVELSKPARVLVNQNWHQGWRTNVGTVVSHEGLLAVDLPEGTSDVVLRFSPRSVWGGMATTWLAMGVAFFLWRSARREPFVQPGRDWLTTAGYCAVPFTAALLSFAAIREPHRPPPPLLTPAGEPMVVDVPPATTQPIFAEFEGIVTLVAAEIRVEPGDDDQTVRATVELDWRLEKRLPAGLGIFVHFETSPKDHFIADHVLLSGVMQPEDAPLHTTIRDVSDPVAVSKGKSVESWNVYVGVWRARLDQRRLHVTSYGTKGGKEDRILIGAFDVPEKPP